jgi:hypothetical protein
MNQELALGTAVQGTGNAVDFSGDWINELGSTMTLKQQDDTLSGVYRSAVSGDEKATTGKLLGFADGEHISFVVHWDDFQAITAWVGQLDLKASPAAIRTLWQMTSERDDDQVWASINAGADKFVRQ